MHHEEKKKGLILESRTVPTVRWKALKGWAKAFAPSIHPLQHNRYVRTTCMPYKCIVDRGRSLFFDNVPLLQLTAIIEVKNDFTNYCERTEHALTHDARLPI
jgi:hypothetical protein